LAAQQVPWCFYQTTEAEICCQNAKEGNTSKIYDGLRELKSNSLEMCHSEATNVVVAQMQPLHWNFEVLQGCLFLSLLIRDFIRNVAFGNEWRQIGTLSSPYPEISYDKG
jgi:hypothetical protein